MDDKVKIRCPACTRIFREKTSRVRDGAEVNCLNCNKLIILTKETENSFLRRALKAAREIRTAKDEAVYKSIYSGVASPQSAKRFKLCQSACKFDPVSASKFDPFDRRGLAVALGPSELAGIAETERARVV